MYSLIISEDFEFKDNKIEAGYTNYINISFIQNKIIFTFLGEKEIYVSKVSIKKSAVENYNLIFGKNGNSSFSGYIGPIIIIKYLSNLKENEIENYAKNILQLKDYYPYFIYFKKDCNYSLEKFTFLKIPVILNKYIENQEKFNLECLLYFDPKILLFKSFKPKKNKNLNLPNIDNICIFHKNYEIKEMNITLVKHEYANNDFLFENGIIILIYISIFEKFKGK